MFELLQRSIMSNFELKEIDIPNSNCDVGKCLRESCRKIYYIKIPCFNELCVSR